MASELKVGFRVETWWASAYMVSVKQSEGFGRDGSDPLFS